MKLEVEITRDDDHHGLEDISWLVKLTDPDGDGSVFTADDSYLGAAVETAYLNLLHDKQHE